jgi:hypothetical protein
MMDINKISPYPNNPRVNARSIEEVKKSIEANGYNQPILVDQNNVICVGHTRWLALKELDYTEIEVIKKDMTEAEFLRYLMADNKTNERSEWDLDILEEVMDLYVELGGKASGTGFTDSEFDALMDSSDIDDLVGDDITPTNNPNKPKKMIKQVQIFLDDVTFPKFISMCEAIQTDVGTENLTDTIYKTVEQKFERL